MEIEEKALREFVKLWEEECGEKLSIEEAQRQASRLLELYYYLATEPPPPTSDADSTT